MAADEPTLPELLLHAIDELADTLPAYQARYALIGGVAAGMRGRLRYTDDVDLLLTVPQLMLAGLLEALVARGFTCDVVPTVREWVEHHMVVMRYRGIRVDWLKPVVPLYQHVIDSATPEDWRGRTIHVASAEGLILLKLLAGRAQDLLDIDTLLAANQGRLDLGWIERSGSPFSRPTTRGGRSTGRPSPSTTSAALSRETARPSPPPPTRPETPRSAPSARPSVAGPSRPSPAAGRPGRCSSSPGATAG